MNGERETSRHPWRGMIVAALGFPPVAATYRLATRTRLRIIAYHGVPSPGAFARQLDEVIAGYRAVSGTEVAAALAGERSLPAGAVWLTFDDGRADVVGNGLPLLRERRIPATLFVCPGLIEGRRQPWWVEVEDAVRGGWGGSGAKAAELVRAMKRMPDQKRRVLLEEARRSGVGVAAAATPAMASERQVQEWLEAGLEIGNHTWDHPCLDRASAEEQRAQIVRADRWLEELGAFSRVRLFAYPGGAWTPEAEGVLAGCGYQAALLFDHRLAQVRSGTALRLSRLRLDADATVERARAVVCGLHAAILAGASGMNRPVSREG